MSLPEKDAPQDGSGDLVLLGRITGAQGLRGEVRIATFTEAAENIAAYGPLTDRDGRRSFTIEALRLVKGGVVAAQLADVRDRSAAEALRGVELYIEKALLPETEEDEWYYADLVGLAAVDVSGAEIGRITAVQNFGAGDLLEVKLPGSGKTVFVPFTEAAVPEVDIKGKRVIIVMPDEVEAPTETRSD